MTKEELYKLLNELRMLPSETEWVESFQLPPPEFLVTQKHTKAILFAPKVLRNVDEITYSTMHHRFRQPLPDLKSQKYQNSPLFHQLL